MTAKKLDVYEITTKEFA